MHVGDLITIVVAQGTSADNTAAVSTARSLSASSGITALAGKLKTTGVESLFSRNSTATLSGKSQGSTTSAFTDTLAGRVVAVLPSGVMVVEAERQLTMNNERQTIWCADWSGPATSPPLARCCRIRWKSGTRTQRQRRAERWGPAAQCTGPWLVVAGWLLGSFHHEHFLLRF